MGRSVFILLTLPLALAGCNRTNEADAVADPAPQDVVATDSNSELVELPPAFLSRDCATVVAAYSKALGAKQYTIAAQAWAEPMAPDKLALGYQTYGTPALQIGEISEEGAAGSLFCEVTVTLRDGDNPQTPLKQGTITFRRVNDVPGATANQLRWRINNSTFDDQLADTAVSPPA